MAQLFKLRYRLRWERKGQDSPIYESEEAAMRNVNLMDMKCCVLLKAETTGINAGKFFNYRVLQ